MEWEWRRRPDSQGTSETASEAEIAMSGKRNGLPILFKRAAWFLAVVGTVSACLYPAAPRSFLRGERLGIRIGSVFSHKKHEETLKQYGFQCTDCHLYNLAYMQRDRAINEEITRALTEAGLRSCHFCHIDDPQRAKVDLRCIGCHADIRPIQPADHAAGWSSAHGSRIALSETACNQCHSNRFCVQCHSRRDEAARAFHTGSVLMTHPVEARSDPAKCQRCHQPSYCMRCHRSGRF